MTRMDINLWSLLFTIIGVFATIGVGIWGMSKAVKRIRLRTKGNFSPNIAGDHNVINITTLPNDLSDINEQLNLKPAHFQQSLPMAQLLRDFKSAMGSANELVSNQLIKAADIAKAQGLDNELRWIRKEILGYEKADEAIFPQYRIVKFDIPLLYRDERGFQKVENLKYPIRWGASIHELEELVKLAENNPGIKWYIEHEVDSWMRDGPGKQIFGNRKTFPAVFTEYQVKEVIFGIRRRLNEFLLSLPV